MRTIWKDTHSYQLNDVHLTGADLGGQEGSAPFKIFLLSYIVTATINSIKTSFNGCLIILKPQELYIQLHHIKVLAELPNGTLFYVCSLNPQSEP